LQGEAEFLIAGLMHVTDFPQDVATGILQQYTEKQLGCDPGMVPVGDVTINVRLCQDCAEKTGTPVWKFQRVDHPTD
jgi:hypothetical protein